MELDHIKIAHILHLTLIAKKHNRKLWLQQHLCGIAYYDLACIFLPALRAQYGVYPEWIPSGERNSRLTMNRQEGSMCLGEIKP